jgi:hypothetical protein
LPAVSNNYGITDYNFGCNSIYNFRLLVAAMPY